MELSARNVLRGTIRKNEVGVVNAQITLEIAAQQLRGASQDPIARSANWITV